MQAVAIIALLVAGFSLFLPAFGTYSALAASFFALTSFRAHPGLGSATFCINLAGVLVLSPLLLATRLFPELASETAVPAYLHVVAIALHFGMFVFAVAWLLVRDALARYRSREGP